MNDRNTFDVLNDLQTKMLFRNGRLSGESVAENEREPAWSWDLTATEKSVAQMAMSIAIEATYFSPEKWYSILRSDAQRRRDEEQAWDGIIAEQTEDPCPACSRVSSAAKPNAG
jgi:hypothetical protein